MSLHDLNKDHPERLNPMPNQNDQVRLRMAHGTTQHQRSGEEARADGLKFLERQILAVQGGNNKAVFGFLDSSNKFGFKVAPDGTDVLTATDSQLNFNSDQNVLKILDVGNAMVGSNGDTVNWATIPHNQSFVPIVMGFMNDATVASSTTTITNTASIPLPSWTGVGFALNDIKFNTWLQVFADATNIYVLLLNASGVTITPISVTYYIMQETAKA